MTSGLPFILSYPISSATPTYNNESEFSYKPIKHLDCGDSCVKHELRLSNHVGTHVDVPAHFIPDAKMVSDYSEHDWCFKQVTIVDLTDFVSDGVIDAALLDVHLPKNIHSEAVLLITGMGVLRDNERYWSDSIVFKSDIAAQLKWSCPNIRALGIDTISVSSLRSRKDGHEVHRALLSQDIRIIEDMRLSQVKDYKILNHMLLLPYFNDQIDATPVTVIGQ